MMSGQRADAVRAQKFVLVENTRQDAAEFRTVVLSEQRFRFWLTASILLSLVVGAIGTIVPLRIGIKAFQKMEL